MKLFYIKSTIKSLPNFNGSFEHQGSLNSKEYIHWFKLDPDGNLTALTLDQATGLYNLLNDRFSENVAENSIEEIDESKVPYIAFSTSRPLPVEYFLSKIGNYSDVFDIEISGYLPANHNPQ